MKKIFGLVAVTISMLIANSTHAAPLYFNGFETNIAGWDAFGGSFNATRVSSGTNGITSADGSFHAQSSGGTTGASGSATNFGGYNFGAGAAPTAFQEYTTSLDIYLNVAGGWANDTRFDYSSAINNSAGAFLRDFVFNAGFYNDATGPGTGNRFVISASNNAGRSGAFPKNTNAISISDSGWYTFSEHFYENAGVLKVDLDIFNAGNSLVNQWKLGGDLIGGVGGNRYGWIVSNEFNVLAIDNSELRTAGAAAVPEPVSLFLMGIGMLCLLTVSRKRT
ncbi:MAG: secreted agglutinin [Herminiimonas sp.]|nr:secreted agglutinin [Herminiimonas sp.]